VDFTERNKLINELTRRRFVEAVGTRGWHFVHPEDDFKLEFTISGSYSLTTPDGVLSGRATEAAQVLAEVDREAAKL
jgi:hypothetical protein